ncbi:MAG: hypothetical protein GY744_00280 [Gammaproteobacteria bacterium]|nr:hypothetical protein [Gammaproteobacteria bacterium]
MQLKFRIGSIFAAIQQSLSESEAKLKMMILNINAMEIDRVDAITQLTNSGLPQEVIIRIDELWEKTIEV